MIGYKRGDVVLVEIAFSGAPGSKRRPAVVISTDQFHQSGTKLVVAGITSNLLPPSRPGDVVLVDWQAAGLVKPSAYRGVLTTVDGSEVLRVIGALSPGDLDAVERGIATMLGLTLASPSSC